MKFWQRAVAGVLVLAVVAVGPGRWLVEAPLAKAQAGPVASAIAAGCTAGAPGVLVCASLAAAFIVAACNAGLDCTIESIESILPGFFNWFGDGSGTGQQQAAVQYAVHPDYFQVTPEMVAGWNEALADWEVEGWTFAMVGGIDVLWSETPGSELQATVVWPDLGGATCTGIATMSARGVQYRSSGDRGSSTGGVVGHGLAPNVYTTGGTESVPVVGTYNMNVLGYMEPALTCSDFGTPLVVRYIAGAALENGTTMKGGLAGWRTQVSTSGGTKTMEMSASLFVGAGVIAVTVQPDQRVYLPLDVDDLVGWNGTDVLPRADGTTGELVADAPAGDDNQGIIDSILGLGTGVLRDIWARLGEISSTLSGVAADIAALPTTLTALFNPAVAVQAIESDYWPPLSAAFAGSVPVCLIDISGLSEIMTGTGGPFVLDMPNPGGGSVHIEYAVPSSITQYTKLGSQLFASVLVLMYGYGLFRRMFASGGGVAP